MTPRRPVRALVVITAVLVAGCTTVPSNSVPQVVNRVGATPQAGAPPITPQPGADEREIVNEFLNASAQGGGGGASAFLTPDAQNRWQDTTVTVLDNKTTEIPEQDTVVVSGRVVGTITSSGTYQPNRSGDGSGGSLQLVPFGMKKVGGQWRIDQLQNGIIIDLQTFETSYQPRKLYFFDLAEKRLVPDVRWTALTDPSTLAGWLVGQLAAGPRSELQNAVQSYFPAQLDPTHVTVSVTPQQTVVNIPGAGQLSGSNRSKLAAQLATTLEQVSSVNDVSIQDAGKPVTIPQVGTSFNAGDFGSATAPLVSTPALYYLRNGAVVDAAGNQLPGSVGNPNAYGLTSVAVANNGASDLRIAGETGSGSSEQLWLGSVSGGLRRTALSGALSRPAWAPGLDEVWVGDGKRIVRVGPDGKPVTVVPTLANGQQQVGGTVTALRLSPEGSRIAMVISAADGAQVWVGSVVRTAAQVRIDALEPITPLLVTALDVAWNDPESLFLIGVSSGDTNVYSVEVDGAYWRAVGVENLPGAPETITIAENEVAWVSVHDTVWFQRANAWVSPGPNTTAGTAPVYLE